LKFTPDQIKQLNEELPAVAVAGAWGKGKTLFALERPTVGETVWFHTEPSGASYAKLYPVDRIEVNSMEDLRHGMAALKDRQVGHIIVDTISPIEDYLFLDVAAGVDLYGEPVSVGEAKRFAKDSAAVWGEMKKRELVLLTKMMSYANAVTITTHMRAKYIGNRPSGISEPRVKDAVKQFVAVFLILQRDEGLGKPSAEILKSTLLDKKHFTETGEIRPVLPPRLPVANWESIWAYIEDPADEDNLQPEEQSRAMSEQETVRLVAKIAEEATMD